MILEALQCGRPVVATGVGGIPELVDESCSILVPARDAARLATALDEALQRNWDEDTISRRHGRTWEDVGRETYAVCESVYRRSPVVSLAAESDAEAELSGF